MYSVSLPLALAPKISKLVPLLGSNHDGEVVATVRAIDRTLKVAGLDWHALAAALTAVAAPQTERRPSWAEEPPSPPPHCGPPRWRDLDRGERICCFDRLRVMMTFSAWEREFVASIEAKLEAQPYLPLSPKQIAILDRLLAKEWEDRQ